MMLRADTIIIFLLLILLGLAFTILFTAACFTACKKTPPHDLEAGESVATLKTEKDLQYTANEPTIKSTKGEDHVGLPDTYCSTITQPPPYHTAVLSIVSQYEPMIQAGPVIQSSISEACTEIDLADAPPTYEELMIFTVNYHTSEPRVLTSTCGISRRDWVVFRQYSNIALRGHHTERICICHLGRNNSFQSHPPFSPYPLAISDDTVACLSSKLELGSAEMKHKNMDGPRLKKFTFVCPTPRMSVRDSIDAAALGI